MGPAQLSLIPNTLFDYAALDREVEVAARSDAALIKGLMRRTAEDVIEIGKALQRQKRNLPKTFLAWIESEFDMSERAAQRFMSVAVAYGNKSANLAGIGVSALYELSAPETPPEVREEIERRIAAGELATLDDVRAAKEKAAEIAANANLILEQNRDLVANAHLRAKEDAEQTYGALIDDLKQRVALAEETAAKSIQAADADAAAHPDSDHKVVPFTPKDDGETAEEPDPLGGDSVDDVDLNDMRVGAHVIYGSLSSIDLAKTTPEIFWAIFGTPNGKVGTTKWLNSTLKKLKAIKKGMPQ